MDGLEKGGEERGGGKRRGKRVEICTETGASKKVMGKNIDRRSRKEKSLGDRLRKGFKK